MQRTFTLWCSAEVRTSTQALPTRASLDHQKRVRASSKREPSLCPRDDALVASTVFFSIKSSRGAVDQARDDLEFGLLEACVTRSVPVSAFVGAASSSMFFLADHSTKILRAITPKFPNSARSGLARSLPLNRAPLSPAFSERRGQK